MYMYSPAPTQLPNSGPHSAIRSWNCRSGGSNAAPASEHVRSEKLQACHESVHMLLVADGQEMFTGITSMTLAYNSVGWPWKSSLAEVAAGEVWQ